MRLLILGTGGMANQHARNFSAIKDVSVVGGVDVVPERLAAFCAEHKIGKQFASIEDALAWGEFDAVANVTPDRVHHPTTMHAIAANKHVFCEKPLATDATKAMEMTEAIGKAGLVGMVNFTYRNSPALQKGRQMVLDGAIGAVRHVEASHLQSWLVCKAWGDWTSESKWLWRLSKKHGSNGALGDIGIHIVDFASYGSGLDVAHVFGRLKTFDKAPGNKIGEYDLDANDSFHDERGFLQRRRRHDHREPHRSWPIGPAAAPRLRRKRLDRDDLRYRPVVSPRLHGSRSRHRQLARHPL